METRDIERLLYPLLGPGKRLADVEAARAALESAYHTAGMAPCSSIFRTGCSTTASCACALPKESCIKRR